MPFETSPTRIMIEENVYPETSYGQYPVKRRIGDALEIWADRLYVCVNDEKVSELLAVLAQKQSKTRIVSWFNAHALTVSQKDTEYAKNLLASTLLLRDGVGISILLRLLGRDAGINMNGTDFIPKILNVYKGRSVALFGTSEPYLSLAADAIRKNGGNVVLCMDGFKAPEEYLQTLKECKVDLLVLGMGMPRQEKVACYLAENVAEPLLILNGGAILDFLAKRFPRAPKLLRHLRLEWLYRLMLEPRRLWRRYVLGGIVFVFYTAQIVFAKRAKEVGQLQ